MSLKCKNCNMPIYSGDPTIDNKNECFCIDCAFKLRYISATIYMRMCGGLDSNMFKAGINPDTKDIEFTYKNRKFIWERKSSDYRHCPQYRNWRTKVFSRDDFTCMHCGSVGGKLEAHHIKSYKNHKKLQFRLDNGMTLCNLCHRKEHRRIANAKTSN